MKISAAVLCGMLATGCVQEDPQDGRRVMGVQSEAVTVRCEVTAGTPTRSSIDADEDALEDINLYAYCDGKLEAMLYTQSPEDIRMKLYKGRTYNMYALANMGEVEAPISEEDMKDHRYSVGSLREIEGAFPMAWMKEGFTIEGSSPFLGISLERLLARISFSIDRSELDDFQVTAIKLRQGALGVYPFREESRAESASDVADGDWASASDLSTVTAGGEIAFYALENRQGVLMPGNSDPCSKTPDGIPDNSELCTYLEMTSSYSGQYQGVTVSSDNVTYRFYLGEDNCTDFNVIRNKDVKINLKVTEDRIFDESWRVSYGEDLPNIAYGLTNSKSSVSLNVGGSTTLSATYYRTVDGVKDTETDVTSYAAWTSSNPSVATVSGGKITGVAAGTATITATYNGYKATTTVTVNNVMDYGLVMSTSTLSIQAESTASLAVYYVTYTNGVETSRTDVTSSAKWKTSMSSIAMVSGGTVTGVSAGQAVVTATYQSYSKSCTVTVTKKPVTYTYALEVKLADSSINVGETTTATATYITYADGVKSSSKDVTSSASWSSGKTTVATVSGGTVTGKSSGTSAIKATYSGYTASATVTVSDVVTHSLEVSMSNSSIYVGENTSATASYITYTNGTRTSAKDVTSSATWSSSNPAVASVSGGSVTAKATGSATITAAYNGYSATATVTVEEDITYDYQLSPTSTNVVNGRTTKMTVIRRTFTNGSQTNGEDYSSNFTWTSSNTSVATVGSYGVITGVGTGTATITAKYGGTTLTGTVTVTPNYTYELVLNKTSIDMGKGRKETLVATYKTYADGVLESSNDVTSSATWSSSSSSVAGVSGGTITGNGIGSATITATYKGKSATCSVKVTGSPTLSLGWTSVNLKRGDVRTNAAIYNPNNGTASTNVTSSAVWTTSNSGVATVVGGQITAQGKGTCTITATYNGVSASCTVNVTENDTPSTNTYVSNMSVQSVNISGTNDYKLTLSLKFSDGTLVEDAPYTWSVISAQNTSIATGTSGDGPIVYTGGGSAYVMAVTLTTKAYYYDEKGNKRQHTIGTSFSHSAEWKP